MKRLRGLFIPIAMFVTSTFGLAAGGTALSSAAGATTAHTTTVTNTLVYNNVPVSTTDPTINNGRIELQFDFNGNTVAWSAEHGYRFVSVTVKSRGGFDVTFSPSNAPSIQVPNGDIVTYVKAIAVGPALSATTTTTPPTKLPVTTTPSKAALRIATKSLPVAVLRKTYSTKLRITGAIGFFHCRLIRGTHLSPGLSLTQQNCQISGKSTRVGKDRFAVQASDSTRSTSETLTLTTKV